MKNNEELESGNVDEKDENLDKVQNLIKEKDEKLSNQSQELHYLTNDIIPKLKKENSELKSLKIELTQALEKTTKKYYDQLDINADLSDKLTKTSADFAVSKVRMDKLESEVEEVKKEADSKVKEVASEEIEALKAENEKLSEDLSEKVKEVNSLNDKVPALQKEIDNLRKDLIEVGNYKEQVNENVKAEINSYKNHIKALEEELRNKQSKYDELYTESQRTINGLNEQVQKLRKAIDDHSKRGFLGRLSKKSILDE